MKTIVGKLVIGMLVCGSSALAQSSTTMTYQGELRNNGELANGAFDMTFSLWSASSSGMQLGSDIVRNDVLVTQGRFTVELDFGADAFNNQDRFLEIAVEGFTLAPRQAITRSPYSIQTRGIFVNDAGQIGIGTTDPQHQVDVEVDEAVMRLSSTNSVINLWSRLIFQTADPNGPGSLRPVGSIDFQRPDGSPSASIYAQQVQDATTTAGYLYFKINDFIKLTLSDTSTSSNNYFIGNQGIYGQSGGVTPGVSGRASAVAPAEHTYGVQAENHSTNGFGYGLFARHAGDGTAVRAEVDGSSGYAGYFAGGRSYFEGSVGIGTTDPGNAKLQVIGSGSSPAINTAIRAEVSDASAYAGYFAGGRSYFQGAVGIGTTLLNVAKLYIVNETSGPELATGPIGGAHLDINDNIISGRQGSEPGKLLLNPDGGEVEIGPFGLFLPYAVGRLNRSTGVPILDYSTSSVLSVTYDSSESGYRMVFEDRVFISDTFVFIQVEDDEVTTGYRFVDGDLIIRQRHQRFGFPWAAGFSFIVYHFPDD